MSCVVCGASHSICGGPTAMQPVGEIEEGIMAGKTLSVDRGDGYRFKVSEARLARFKARYPNAFVVGAKPEVVAATVERRPRNSRAARPEAVAAEPAVESVDAQDGEA